MAIGVLERQVDVSVAVDIRLAGDCTDDGTSLVLRGNPFIPSARGDKRRTGALQGAKFVCQDRFIRVSDRLCTTYKLDQPVMKGRSYVDVYEPSQSTYHLWYWNLVSSVKDEDQKRDTSYGLRWGRV